MLKKIILIHQAKSDITEVIAKRMKEIIEKYEHNCQIYQDKEIKKYLKSQSDFFQSYDIICLIFVKPVLTLSMPPHRFLKIIRKLKIVKIDKKKKVIGFALARHNKIFVNKYNIPEEAEDNFFRKFLNKTASAGHIYHIGCVKRESEIALKDFDNLIRNLK